MKEQLSALMDGQLEDADCDGCLRRLKDDDDLREDWAVYHLIGDALRGTPSRGLSASFADKLSAEPTVLAPGAAPRRKLSPRRQAWYALSAAASVAAVAAVGWVALPMIQPPGPTIVQGPVTTPTTVQVTAPQIVPVATGVGDYVLAHQRFAPRAAIAGIMPYVGSVADDAARR